MCVHLLWDPFMEWKLEFEIQLEFRWIFEGRRLAGAVANKSLLTNWSFESAFPYSKSMVWSGCSKQNSEHASQDFWPWLYIKCFRKSGNLKGKPNPFYSRDQCHLFSIHRRRNANITPPAMLFRIIIPGVWRRSLISHSNKDGLSRPRFPDSEYWRPS